MKRFFSLVLSVLLAVCTLSGVPASALANSFETATPVKLAEAANVEICCTTEKTINHWLQFDCVESGYYSVTIKSASAPEAVAQIAVYNSSKELIDFAANNNCNAEYSFCTYLSSGNSYFYKFSVYNAELQFSAVIAPHMHSFTITNSIRAVADDDAENRLFGYTTLTCAMCGYTYTAASYAPPAAAICKPQQISYTGYELTPEIIVTDINGAVIDKSNYTVYYEDNLLTGAAYATVVFNNALYNGELTAPFIIIPKKATALSLKSNKAKQLTFKWQKDTTISGYEYQYSTSKKFYKSKTKTVDVSKNSTTSATVKNLIAKKKYYVRIREYKTINGVKYYGAWSASLNVKVKK